MKELQMCPLLSTLVYRHFLAEYAPLLCEHERRTTPSLVEVVIVPSINALCLCPECTSRNEILVKGIYIPSIRTLCSIERLLDSLPRVLQRR